MTGARGGQAGVHADGSAITHHQAVSSDLDRCNAITRIRAGGLRSPPHRQGGGTFAHICSCWGRGGPDPLTADMLVLGGGPDPLAAESLLLGGGRCPPLRSSAESLQLYGYLMYGPVPSPDFFQAKAGQ